MYTQQKAVNQILKLLKKDLRKKYFIKASKNDNAIPFDNNYFDILINRHDSYDIQELKRILKRWDFYNTTSWRT